MSYQALFYPHSIAIIGASRHPQTVGNDVVKNLVNQGYQGHIYPVNPKADVLYGKKVFPNVSSIPTDIDLVVVAIPAPAVTQVIKESHLKKAQAAIVISSGFKETHHANLETELAQFCQENGISLVGPNCLGVINPEIRMNASFASIMPKPGNIAFISQSGALCTAVLDYAQKLDIGFSKFISIGNKADVDELKMIKYLAQDPQTKVMLFYVEQLENARQIIDAVRKITRGKNAKPIIMLKAGRTQAGAKAIVSHTGSLGGEDVIYEALFKQAGIIRADSIEQLFNYAQFFSHHHQLQQPQIKNVTVITNAGGPGVLVTDELTSRGLSLATLSLKTTTQLQRFLPENASLRNPVDILGDAKAVRYQQSLEIIIQDKNTDAVLIILTPQSMTEIEDTAAAIVAAQKTTSKPISVCFMGQKTVNPGVKIMQAGGVVTTTFPEPAAQSLATYSHFLDWRQTQTTSPFRFKNIDQETVKHIFKAARKRGQTVFPEAEALQIIEAYGFSVLKNARAKSAAEAAQLVTGMRGKFAMKIISPDILHKSDVGGVTLNVTAATAATQYKQLIKRVATSRPTAKLEGALLMEMAPTNGVEVILGVKKAPHLGTVLMFGLGGIYVEIFKDVNFAFAPLSKTDTMQMINSLHSSPLFDEARGRQAIDKQALAESLGRLSQLVMDFPEIKELDINPLLALTGNQGVKVLDARLMIE